MTPRTPQCEVFWALLSNLKHSGVPEDSKSPTLEVLGFTPTLGQSGVATTNVMHKILKCLSTNFPHEQQNFLQNRASLWSSQSCGHFLPSNKTKQPSKRHPTTLQIHLLVGSLPKPREPFIISLIVTHIIYFKICIPSIETHV
jgi:hypothetical protein